MALRAYDFYCSSCNRWEMEVADNSAPLTSLPCPLCLGLMPQTYKPTRPLPHNARRQRILIGVNPNVKDPHDRYCYPARADESALMKGYKPVWLETIHDLDRHERETKQTFGDGPHRTGRWNDIAHFDNPDSGIPSTEPPEYDDLGSSDEFDVGVGTMGGLAFPDVTEGHDKT